MLIIAFFTNQGTPATGLTPTIDIWEADGTQVVSGATMTEVGGGFYKYDFTNYDGSKHYCIRADGGPTLPTDERYQYGTNEHALVWEEAVDHHQVPGTFGAKNQRAVPSENIDDYKADVSALALEATVQAIKAKTDNLPSDPASQSAIEDKIDQAEANIRGADNDDLKAISDQLDAVQADLDNPDQYKADVSDLAKESTVQAIKQAVDFIKGIEGGRWKIENNQMIFYDEDNSTELARFDLFDKDGNPSEENVYERRRV